MNTPLGLTEIISKLEKQEGKRLPPVHLWNPPLCENVEMKINSKGDWFFNNSPINRKKMVQLFSTVLRRDEEGYFLVTPVEKIKVVVEKKPFVIIDFEIKEEEKKQTIFFLTNTNDVVKLSKSNKLTVEIEENTKEPFPYIEVRDRLEALISRNVFYKLVDLAKEEKGRLYIESDSQTFILGET